MNNMKAVLAKALKEKLEPDHIRFDYKAGDDFVTVHIEVDAKVLDGAVHVPDGTKAKKIEVK